jgi:hypothetical protein
MADHGAEVTVYWSKITNSLVAKGGSRIELGQSYVAVSGSNSYCLKSEQHGYIGYYDCFFEKTGSIGGCGARAMSNSTIECAYLSCFKNFNIGLQVYKGGHIDMGAYYSQVENCTTGLYAYQGGRLSARRTTSMLGIQQTRTSWRGRLGILIDGVFIIQVINLLAT